MNKPVAFCDYCGNLFEPARHGQRFCAAPGKNCRARWHRDRRAPGKVTGIRALKVGWAVTVQYNALPPGLSKGAAVSLETADKPRPDA